MRPIISVVMVTYNHERYIDQAIKSVLEQEVDGEIEILIGDDGSTDKTVDILDQYEKRYPNKIRLFKNRTNLGLSQNEYGLFIKAQGEYIAILEGDDYWIDKKKLEKQLKQLSEYSCIATACNSLIVNSENQSIGYWSGRNENIVIGKKEIERLQTAVFHPSAVLFYNFFYGSGDQYDIIKKASKMGGGHSGIINLIGFKGNLLLTNDIMTVWRKVLEPEGSNYSATAPIKVTGQYEALKKYINYQKYFGDYYNFYDYIFEKFILCEKELITEFIHGIGKKKIIFMRYVVVRQIKHIWYKIIEKRR